ncbi:MAG TPA: family 10 glycosylhydrolase [Armatimonadota bacterium]|nr:family 10 glycosylhydrolase [Armatimonadota bacterium]
MKSLRLLPILLLLCALAPACNRPDGPPTAIAPNASFLPSEQTARVVLIAETEGPGGAAVAESASALETLVAHFDERCHTISAEHYEEGALLDYYCVFYLAGQPDRQARSKFSADLARHKGTAVWVGPGVTSFGNDALAELGLRETPGDESLAGAIEWAVSYKGRAHRERLAVPALTAVKEASVSAGARGGAETRPFVAGRGRRWYVAAGPSLDRRRFWTACIWADVLHDIMARPHDGRPKRLLPVLRDVPVWARTEQVPRAVQPMLESGIPVAIMAWTNWGDVPMADRPDAVEGLRQAESMGATVALVADTHLDPREHFRLAWEVGLHPVAWGGPTNAENPFSLRIAGPNESPAYCAGGLLPAPIDITDAAYIAAEDADRLHLLEVVRDAVALVSFGLWAPPQPFQSFLKEKQSRGWMISDARDLDVRVTDARRTLVSGTADLQVPAGAHVREVVFGPKWNLASEKVSTAAGPAASTLRLKAPDRGAIVAELVKQRPPRPFIKGVTLDPWTYGKSSLSSKELAEMLAERYYRNGVNTVFFYTYNVDQGAAYRTRYRGASVSEWGRQDLLAHVLEACHARDIRVVAWLYSGRDSQMWKKHPEWRERTRDGKAHNPLRLHAAYFLCPRNPEVRDWYAGLLRDLARRYPTLDGIELCEPVVNWFGDQACYCEVCRQAFAAEHPQEPLGREVWRRFRAQSLTDFLSGCMKAVSQEGIDTYIMTISDAWSNGAILSPRRQAEESGFDLEALLDGPYPPDWVNFEIIWQQWAAIYGTEVFNYDWAEETARRLVRRTDGRAHVLLHVELTDFGSQRMTPTKMAHTIARVQNARPNGIECYHSGAVDSKAAWPVLKQSYEDLP